MYRHLSRDFHRFSTQLSFLSPQLEIDQIAKNDFFSPLELMREL